MEDSKKISKKVTLLQRETKRQRVARELVMQRAGKALPEDTQLLRPRSKPEVEEQLITTSRQEPLRQESFQEFQNSPASGDDVDKLGSKQQSPCDDLKR